MGFGARLLARTAALQGLACSRHAPADPVGPAPTPTRTTAPPPLPQGYYDPPPGPAPSPSVTPLPATRGCQAARWRLPARPPADLAWIAHADQPIDVTLWRPRSAPGPHPLVLLSPILESGTALMPQVAAAFTARGFAAALVHRKDVRLDTARPIEQAEAEMRLLVLRGRQALDALIAHAPIDPDRLATFGISAGGMVSALLAGTEPRLRAHAWAFAGGPMADVMIDTVEPRFRGYRLRLERAGGWTREQLRARLRATLLTDPVHLAPRVARDDVLLFLARLDTSVRVRHGYALHAALGRPALRLLPFGHRASFLFLPYVLAESAAFLSARLGPRADAAPVRSTGSSAPLSPS